MLAACTALLGDRRGLLVVDNCEHLLDGVRDMVDAPAALLDAAADHAPDAPATDTPRPAAENRPGPEAPGHATTAPAAPIPGRIAVLEVARQAMERHLARS